MTTGPDVPARPDSGIRREGLARREQRLAWGLLAPAVLIVLALILVPILWNVTLSLRDIDLIDLRDFSPLALELSLDNYTGIMGDREFWPLLRRTFLYAVLSTSLSIILGLWAAMTLRATFPGRAAVRGLILFPYVVPTVAAAFLWRTMLNPQIGIVNDWLTQTLGISKISFLTTRAFEVSLFGLEIGVPAAFSMVILFEAWRSFPFAFLFILARLQAMPDSIEEAAMVDGASIIQRFRYVTLPQLRAVFATLFLLRFIWTFNAFDEIFLLTGGAAGTRVVSVGIYEQLFGRNDIGGAAALSITLAIVLMLLLLVYFRYVGLEEE